MARHHVVFGLGFGDEGKGGVCDYLARRERPAFVVRFNGGAQAQHNVVCDDGTHHTFAQYGSGAFAGARTFLSRFMIVNPLAMLRERDALKAKSVAAEAFVDERCLITTPYHVALNQLREAAVRHGSCGMGIGETVRASLEGVHLTAGELRSDGLERKIKQIADQLYDVGAGLIQQAVTKMDALAIQEAMYKLAAPTGALTDSYQRWIHSVALTSPDWLARQIEMDARCLFEGAQGVLLDETHGWAPNNTWSTCTPKNALELLGEAGVMRDDIEVTGVLRAFHTRHGAGPLPTETVLPIAELHNGDHPWQGAFRWGHFDGRLARYALEVSGRVDQLAITHLDHNPASKTVWGCRSYRDQLDWGKPRIYGAEPELIELSSAHSLVSCVNALLPDDAPWIGIESYGPTASDKRVPR